MNNTPIVTKEEEDVEAEGEALLNEYLRILPMANPVAMALQNYRMTTLGKIVFASMIATMVTGQRSPFKLSGDPRKINVLARAIQSSKRYQDEIRRPGATVDSVFRALDLKHVDARNFKAVYGADWPL